ncbi:MAG: hypothetical protein ACOZIN_16230 [Myxococcota bacterium]
MRARWPTLLFLFAATLAQAQDDDAPIPYPEEEEETATPRKLPRRSEATADLREESEYEALEREESLAGVDDPNIGVGGEWVAGLMLLDSARGQGVESRFAYGLRFTWELGRVLADERLREALFADVTWSYAALREGSQEVFGDTNYHYFTVAPAYGFRLGQKSSVVAYLQAGLGLAYQFHALHVSNVETQISGTKPVLQYGAGIRGRPAVVGDESLRVSLRLELTRFRRGYMDDTFLGAGIGAVF